MGASIIPSISGAQAGAPILPNIGAARVPSDVTAVTPRQESEAQPSLYEQLQEIYTQALDYRHGRTGSGRKYTPREVDRWIIQQMPPGMAIRTMRQLSVKLDQLDRAGQRPINVEDLPWYARGAMARVVKAGHGMSFGTSDRLAGLVTAAGERGPTESFGAAYKRGRDAQREYLNQAAMSTNSFPLSPEGWGAAASMTALAGLGGPPPTLARSTGLGGAFGLGGGLAAMPEITPHTLRENAGPLALNTLLGAAIGGGTHYALGELPMAIKRPGDYRLFHELESMGGEHALSREVAGASSPRPLLGELGGTEFSALVNDVRKGSRAAARRALTAVGDELQNVRVMKASLDQQYGILSQPINVPRAGEILAEPRVANVVKRMMKGGDIQPGQRVTGRLLEDVRQRVSEAADRAFDKGFRTEGKQLRGFATELRNLIDGQIQGAPELRSQWGQLVQRETQLAKMESRLSMPPRGSKRLSPIKPSLHSSILRVLGREPGQVSRLEANQMSQKLFRPGTAAEHASRLSGVEGVPFTPGFGMSQAVPNGLPWYAQFGQVGPIAGGVATNPFFQQEPQQEQ